MQIEKVFSNSPSIVAPIILKGGRHPSDISQGKSKFPISAPDLPNIIASETVIVLNKFRLKCFLSNGS